MRFCHPLGSIIGRNQSRFFLTPLLRMTYEQEAIAWTRPVVTVNLSLFVSSAAANRHRERSEGSAFIVQLLRRIC